jgi:hypothetical protein
MQARRRAGLSNFPELPPAGSACPASDEDRLAQPSILDLQVLQPLHLVRLQAAVLVAPAVASPNPRHGAVYRLRREAWAWIEQSVALTRRVSQFVSVVVSEQCALTCRQLGRPPSKQQAVEGRTLRPPSLGLRSQRAAEKAIALPARARILVISEALTEHGSYLDSGARGMTFTRSARFESLVDAFDSCQQSNCRLTSGRRRRLGIGSGQCELYGRARPSVGGRPDPTAMCLDDRAADRQPHTHAVRLGGEERIE